MLPFPYQFRPHQKDIISTLDLGLEGGMHVVMESGTGTGKTVCTLYSLYKYVLANKEKRIIYTTRTNSQHHQVITETKRLKEISREKLSIVGFQGRNHFCLLLKDLALWKNEDMDEETPVTIEELAAYCAKRRRHTKEKIDKEIEKKKFKPLSGLINLSPVNELGVEIAVGKRHLKDKGCIYYENLLRGGLPVGDVRNNEDAKKEKEEITFEDSLLKKEVNNIFVKWLLENNPDTGELLSFCRLNRICPYELNKMACEKANAVVVPYIFFFAPFLRRYLLDWMNTELKNIILVVDEAHNLPDYARELQSSTLSRKGLELVVSEGVKYSLLKITDEVHLQEICSLVEDAIEEFLELYLVDEDGLIPDFALEEKILCYFKMSSPQFKQVVGSIIKMGIGVKEIKLNANGLPSSHIYNFGTFLLHWLQAKEDYYIRLINKDGVLAGVSEEKIYFVDENGTKQEIGVVERGEKKVKEDNPRLEIFCLDPSLTTSVINNCYASVHLSGTLKPIEQYVDCLALQKERVIVRSFPSPFPEKNRLYLYLDDVTTRYEDYMRDLNIRKKIGEYLNKIAFFSQGRNTIFFFPSFKLLQKYSKEKWVGELKRKVFVERQGMSNQSHYSLIQEFKSSDGGLLFSVVGGRTSEGMDFPGKALEVVVVVGIPYPKPTVKLQALQFYNQQKFGRGYFYTFHAPASRKLAQALGRLIRTEEDRGVGIILDKRAHRFTDYIHGIKRCEDLKKEFEEFWAQK